MLRNMVYIKYAILGLLLLNICTGFENLGCYYDYSNNRTIPGLNTCSLPEPEEKCSGCSVALPYCESSEMTVEFCHDLCHRRGFLYSGLEAGNQCFCGNDFDPENPANGEPPTEQNCTEPCTGDSAQKCGGELRIIMYKNNAFMNCSTPIQFSNGTVTPDQAVYAPETTVTLQCNNGYYQVGPTESYCWYSGVFSHITQDVQPGCIRECFELNDPSRLEISRDVQFTDYFVVGDTITYTCNVGYEVKNNSVSGGDLECREDRLWAENLPLCKGVSCGDPGIPDNGQLIGDQFIYPYSISYECNPGYTLVGDSSRKCESDKLWTNDVPECQPVECGSLTNIENGAVSFTSTTFGMKANYTCVVGYELMGDITRTCGEDAMWSGSIPSCQLIRCENPETPDNALRSHANETYGSTVSFICDDGYNIMGAQSIMCQANGMWSDNVPTCEIVSCGNPGTPNNGERIGDVETYNSTVSYTCNTGYNVMGAQSIICQANGTWSDISPTCQIVDCLHPGNPVDVIVEVTTTTYMSIVRYTCPAGYSMSSGDDWGMCTADGSWSGTEPTCSIGSCGEPDNPEFAIRTGDSYDVGANVSYKCMTGYEKTAGNAIITCNVNSNWSGEAIVCSAINCGNPGIPSNGEKIGNDETYLSFVMYTCNSGYDLVGVQNITCQADKMWSSSVPMCQKSPTTAEPDMPNSSSDIPQTNSMQTQTNLPTTAVSKTQKSANNAQTGESDISDFLMYIVAGIAALLLLVLILGTTYILAKRREKKQPLTESTSIEAIPNPAYVDGFAESPMSATNEGFEMTEDNEMEPGSPTSNGSAIGNDATDGWNPTGHLESETSGGKFKPKFLAK